MKDLTIHTDPEFDKVFNDYPETARRKLLHLRDLIIETAGELEGVDELQETLKWGEPSFLVKKGSTLRIDWKEKNPSQYALYFKCTSRLVPTFKKIFQDTFTYEGDRAIVFQMDDSIPAYELKKAVGAALSYHRVKHLPNLGM